MSLPAELRTICHLIASNELSKLPYITPILLRNLMCCGEVLSAGDELAKRSDASESMVLVHKFRTQISTLLYGKVPGGRFAAVVLIKAMVELGGWEILRGCEPWVKGLLLELAVSLMSSLFCVNAKVKSEARYCCNQEHMHLDTCKYLYSNSPVSNSSS